MNKEEGRALRGKSVDPRLVDLASCSSIIASLRQAGLDKVADRIGYLQSLVEDDPDEPPIALESLRQMALFLVSERQLGDPQIGVSPDGLMGAQWRTDDDDLVVMEFLADGLIRFAAISASSGGDLERQRVSGILGKNETLQALGSFTSRLVSL